MERTYADLREHLARLDAAGLPALRPEAPWFGYDMGDWTEEWDANAMQAARGEWMERSERYRQRRARGVAPNSPVRGQEEE